MRMKAKYFILLATLLGGFQALPASANTGGGVWLCKTNEAVLNWNNPTVQGVVIGSQFFGSYEQAVQQMKGWLVKFDSDVRKGHPDYAGDIVNAAYSCSPYPHY